MTTLINIEAIENKGVTSHPYPYFGLENALHQAYKDEIIKDFPILSKGGSFPLDSIEVKGSLKSLVDEISGDKFRNLIAKKFDVNLSAKPLVITARGYSRINDGKIHTDSKTKLITILIYLNEVWGSPNGRLRILNSNDIEDYKEEFSSSFGQMIAFKVTDNCWHGYQPYEGKRRSLQINYLVDQKYKKYHIYRHRVSALFKKYFKK